MRVYISVDMEGVAGVVHEDQTDPSDPRHAGEYNRFRRHAMAGTRHAVIDHTYTSIVHQVRLNGHPAGELAINAALADTYGVPVALVSGDQTLAAETKGLLGDDLEAVIVK